MSTNVQKATMIKVSPIPTGSVICQTHSPKLRERPVSTDQNQRAKPRRVPAMEELRRAHHFASLTHLPSLNDIEQQTEVEERDVSILMEKCERNGRNEESTADHPQRNAEREGITIRSPLLRRSKTLGPPRRVVSPMRSGVPAEQVRKTVEDEIFLPLRLRQAAKSSAQLPPSSSPCLSDIEKGQSFATPSSILSPPPKDAARILAQPTQAFWLSDPESREDETSKKVPSGTLLRQSEAEGQLEAELAKLASLPLRQKGYYHPSTLPNPPTTNRHWPLLQPSTPISSPHHPLVHITNPPPIHPSISHRSSSFHTFFPSLSSNPEKVKHPSLFYRSPSATPIPRPALGTVLIGPPTTESSTNLALLQQQIGASKQPKPTRSAHHARNANESTNTQNSGISELIPESRQMRIRNAPLSMGADRSSVASSSSILLKLSAYFAPVSMPRPFELWERMQKPLPPIPAPTSTLILQGGKGGILESRCEKLRARRGETRQEIKGEDGETDQCKRTEEGKRRWEEQRLERQRQRQRRIEKDVAKEWGAGRVNEMRDSRHVKWRRGGNRIMEVDRNGVERERASVIERIASDSVGGGGGYDVDLEIEGLEVASGKRMGRAVGEWVVRDISNEPSVEIRGGNTLTKGNIVETVMAERYSEIFTDLDLCREEGEKQRDCWNNVCGAMNRLILEGKKNFRHGQHL